MKIDFATTAFAAALTAALIAPLSASAQPRRPLAQHVTPGSRPTAAPRAAARPLAAAPTKTIYGVIQQVFGPHAFVLHRRSGRLQNVDYTSALQTGNYSYPIFAGKFVMVVGSFDAKKLFHATYLNRMSYVDVKGTPPDDAGS